MKNMVKKVFYFMLVAAAMIIVSNGREVRAEKGMDDFLYDTGMPREVIDELTENQKALICESVTSGDRFSSYDSQQFVVGEDGGIMPTATIRDSDLTLNLVAYKCTLDIGEAYAVFPSFAWKNKRVIANDSFTFLLADGWEVVVDPEDKDYHYYNMRIHVDDPALLIKEYDIEPTDLYFNGQSYRMPGYMSWDAVCEGNAVYYVEKKSPSASHKAILHYVHDTTPDNNVSYGISCGILSISVTQNTNYLDVKNAYFGF